MFDDREVTLRSRPLTVHVRPLPKPEPDDFTGGVGRFKMRTSLDREEVAQGEPITLTVHIEGTGNVPSVGMPPLPDLEPQFRAFAPSAPAYEPTRDGDLMGGSSEFSVVLVPETTGRLAVPPIHVSTFRPSTGRYEQLTSDSLFVQVVPGAATAGGGVPGEVTRTVDLRIYPEHHRAAAGGCGCAVGLGPILDRPGGPARAAGCGLAPAAAACRSAPELVADPGEEGPPGRGAPARRCASSPRRPPRSRSTRVTHG
ncbi:MAG: BatD family protein [Candidatus Eisenbacteria bacterium]